MTGRTFYARAAPPVPGAQWTGVLTRLAVAALESGLVEAVVCVQSDPNDPLAPRPVLARTAGDILAARGVKPCLSPNLETLATVEAAGVKRLLFIGVGCQVQALRAIEPYLGLDALYVIGTNCTDNGDREGLRTFLNAASADPATALHYEFMQDYRVHIKHTDGSFEYVPYFSLPANQLTDVISPSCYSCFDYTNSLADAVVGYMGVPYSGADMTGHWQHVTLRNARASELWAAVEGAVETKALQSSGSRASLVQQTVVADDEAKLGRGPNPAPTWVGSVIAKLLTWFGPKGLEFGKYSVDYHYVRNWIYVNRYWGRERAEAHIPEYAKRIVAAYDRGGAVTARLREPAPPGPKGPRIKK